MHGTLPPTAQFANEAARFQSSSMLLCLPAAVALAAPHARVELPQHNAWPSLVSRRPPSPEECTLCVCRMLCASRPFKRPLVPINTAVDPHELRFPRRMRRTRPAPACSASNLSRLMLTRVDVLWLECQWCRQRSHEDAAARCRAGPCPCIPDAGSSRGLEAEERGCLRLSEDTDSSEDGLLSIFAARVLCV